jgi:hypothetical protein
MKKYITVLFAVLAFAIGADAQTTTPRTGVGTNQDLTYRQFKFAYTSITDATPADTTRLKLNAFHTLVKCASVVDSITIYPNDVTQCYGGDKLEIVVINSSGAGHKLKVIGGNVEFNNGQTGSIALTSAKRANIVLLFDGVKWVEQSRVVQ